MTVCPRKKTSSKSILPGVLSFFLATFKELGLARLQLGGGFKKGFKFFLEQVFC